MSSIKKIVLEVGGVELSLSPEDAKALQSALNELFPVPAKQLQFVPYSVPVTMPVRPYWYEYGGGIRLLSTSGMGSSGASATPLNLSGSSFQLKSQ